MDRQSPDRPPTPTSTPGTPQRRGAALPLARLAGSALALAAVGALAVLGGCPRPEPVDVEPTHFTVEPLLARTTIERVGDVESYRPNAREGFGAADAGGWQRTTTTHAGLPAVLATHGIGRLALSAGAPRDRRIEILAARGPGIAEGTEPVLLHAELGGVRVTLGELGDDWRQLSFDVPAEHWHEGRNRLTLEIENKKQFDERLLAVAAVAVLPADAPRPDLSAAAPDPTTPQPRRRDLGPSEAVRMVLADGDGARLDLAAASDGEGELLVELVELSPSTGLRGAAVLEDVVPIDAGEPARATVALPAEAPAVAELELRWYPADGRTPLRLERADLARPGPAPPPLVIFLSVDTLAAKNMSLLGYERPTTPFLERFAEDTVVFDRAYANCPWTLPSYISQLTAMLPNSHRIENRDAREDGTPWSEFQLADSRFTLAELFNAAGYRTAGIVDNPFLSQLRGLRQGFERLDDTPATRPLLDLDGGMKLVAETALRWIDEPEDERPLFLFMQVLDVHGPYITTPPWQGTFASEGEARGPLRPVADSFEVAVGAVPEYIAEGAWRLGVERADEVPVGVIRDAYDEKVLELDARVEQFVADLEARGLRDDALFVLTADHGEITTQHEIYFRHGPLLEPSIHIPWIVDLPGSRGAGRRIDDPVSLLDLMPTLAELIGLDPEPFAFHGRSLVPLIDGGELRERPIAVHTTFRNSRSVSFDGWKLVLYHPAVMGNLATVLTHEQLWTPWAAEFPELARELAGRDDLTEPPLYDRQRFRTFLERHPDVLDRSRRFYRDLGPQLELFDLANDPDERFNCIDDHPERAAALTAIMRAADQLTIDAQVLARADEFGDPLPSAMLAELEALGYVDGGATNGAKNASDGSESEGCASDGSNR